MVSNFLPQISQFAQNLAVSISVIFYWLILFRFHFKFFNPVYVWLESLILSAEDIFEIRHYTGRSDQILEEKNFKQFRVYLCLDIQWKRAPPW